MIDFDIAIQTAFDRLSKGNSVKLLSLDDKAVLPFLSENSINSSTVFSIRTEYLNVLSVAEDIEVYMVFKPDFPLSLPKVYLPRTEYDRIKYIPHIDKNCFICTFDVDTTRTNPKNPGGIAQECLSRAIKIIETGLSKTNQSDFTEEFKAYWENEYDNEDDVKQDILALLSDYQNVDKLNFIKLSKSISIYNHVIYQDNEIGRRFLNYLEYRKIDYTNESICYLGCLQVPFHPPFSMNNEKVAQIISSLTQSQRTAFRRYINTPGNTKFLLGYVLIGVEPIFIGWIHSKFDLKKRNGFRKESLNNFYVFNHFQKKDKVLRVSPKIYSPEQAAKRTNGVPMNSIMEYKFLIAGLGSIGSNLLYFLNSLNNPEFRLVDFDELRIDNLNRHFLGINYLGMFKTVALKNNYILRNPFQVISSREESFINTCQANLDYVNDSDFIFCAIGKANIDQWIGHALHEGIITKPIFFIWVEPYLSGGHCLYLSPGSKSYDSFFDEYNFFKNNIIDNHEYIRGNPQLSLRETGCQISFTPYSLNNVTAFLAAIFPKIKEIIENARTSSVSISWLGELEILNKLGISLSAFAKEHSGETLIISQ